MVCKKSLYCWKNGPCASDQTRKQIWEDNIKFRESLRDINQSDHYWSFQILKNRCLCLEGEELLFDRPLLRRYRSGSFQKLHHIDCTSITHDFNGLKFRNCYVHCPIHDFSKRAEEKQSSTKIYPKENSFTCSKNSLQPLKTSSGDKIEFCPRYKNTLTCSNLKPGMKMKFPSQSSLNQLCENKSLVQRKTLYSSCQNIPSLIQETKLDLMKEQKEGLSVNKSINCNLKVQSSESCAQHKTKKEKKVKVKKANKDLTAKFFNPIVMHQYPPVSRTTRKMLSEKEKIPFITYGCNNSNVDVSSKRTHNVLASKLEVYPNALSAKQQKRDLILKHIQSEREIQKCIPDFKRKLVNHSSLWSVDSIGKGNRGLQKKSSKQILPNMDKMMKKPPNQFISSYNGENLLPKVNCTPKNQKSVAMGREEFGLYHLHRESSPNFRAGQDVLEVGWGDSPEPLNIDRKFELDRTPVTCKKKLEPKESPRSSLPFKRRNVCSTFNSPSNSFVDVEKYVAEVQELSKNIMEKFNAQEIDKDSKENKRLSSPAHLSEFSVKPCNVTSELLLRETKDVKILELNCDTSDRQKSEDSTLDSVLQSFINEEDDWLCQALSTQEVGKFHKGNFVKSKSENELSITPSKDLEKKSLTQNCRNVNNNLKRTSSFDMSKPQNSSVLSKCNVGKKFSETKRNFINEKNENGPSTQYTLQEIERKRLEAKYRRERKEIERKKFEALKKLEMKKLRIIRT